MNKPELSLPSRKAEIIRAIRREKRAHGALIGPYFTAQETIIKYGQKLKDLYAEYPQDVIYVEGGGLLGPWGAQSQKTLVEKGTFVDDAGIVWMHSPLGVGPARKASPLDDLENLDSYIRDYLYDYSIRPSQTPRIVRENPNSFVMYLIGQGFFEELRGLRGDANALTDFYLHKHEVNRLQQAYLPIFLQLIRHAAREGADGVMMQDDFGIQTQLFMNPAMWRNVFKPFYREAINEIHQLGMLALFHSCGNITEILPDFIELHLDSLHPIQPGAMDQQKIAAQFGKHITFHTGADVQNWLPYVTPRQVEENILRVFEIFDRSHGGFIFSPTNTINPEVPFENIVAMVETVTRLSNSGAPLSKLEAV